MSGLVLTVTQSFRVTMEAQPEGMGQRCDEAQQGRGRDRHACGHEHEWMEVWGPG